jgi:hypothetical protein
LGSSTDDEAIDYFKEMDQNKNIFTWKDDLDSIAIEAAFDKTKVQARKEWIDSFEVYDLYQRFEVIVLTILFLFTLFFFFFSLAIVWIEMKNIYDSRTSLIRSIFCMLMLN